MGNTKNIAFWVILFLLMVALFNVFSNGNRTSMGREKPWLQTVAQEQRLPF